MRGWDGCTPVDFAAVARPEGVAAHIVVLVVDRAVDVGDDGPAARREEVHRLEEDAADDGVAYERDPNAARVGALGQLGDVLGRDDADAAGPREEERAYLGGALLSLVEAEPPKASELAGLAGHLARLVFEHGRAIDAPAIRAGRGVQKDAVGMFDVNNFPRFDLAFQVRDHGRGFELFALKIANFSNTIFMLLTEDRKLDRRLCKFSRCRL